MEKALVEVGFHDPANPKRLMPGLRRFFAKAGLEKRKWRSGAASVARDEKPESKP
jgi:tRNA C32,U32 (ribose-2'-O)-methylase TrmJ